MTNLGIEFRLMTQFTSFVAVEEMTITKGGQPRKVLVPVDLPDGMSYEGLTGEKAPVAPPPPAAAPPVRKPPAAGRPRSDCDRPGGVPNVGTGGDPFKQAMQNTTPEGGTPEGWASKKAHGRRHHRRGRRVG